jgi:predicted lipid-binding transport protein (Tim44 family)
VVTLPRRDGPEEEDRFAAIDAFTPAGTPLNDSLRELSKADPSFNPKEFVNGARMAYEMIVMAFAEGDRKSLKGLLSREVYDGFDAAIADREAKGETVKSTFVGIDKADIVTADLKGTEAFVTMRIVSQMISATYDKAGTLIDGDAETVAEISDLWTFARDTRSRDPNWKLVATESEQ